MMDKNTIFAKLFRLTPFAYDVPAFIDFMEKDGHAVTKSQVNCWQRKRGSKKSRPVPDFAFKAIFNYLKNKYLFICLFVALWYYITS